MRSSDPKRVGIWLRVSTEDQVRGESPETHERRARAYADSKDMTLYTYDKDAPGKSACTGDCGKAWPAATAAANALGRGSFPGG